MGLIERLGEVAEHYRKTIAARGIALLSTARQAPQDAPILYGTGSVPLDADGNPTGSIAVHTDGRLFHKGVGGDYAELISPGPGRVVEFYDFHGDVGQGILPFVNNGETANSSLDYVSGQGFGVLRILTDATSEGQAENLTTGDTLNINLSNNPFIEFRVRIAPAGATLTADERAVFGVGTAHANAEDALDSVAVNAWFRIEGANLNLLAEVDDTSTDDDDNDTTQDYVKSTWVRLGIDFSDLSAVGFYVNGVLALSLDLSGVSANTYVQPIVCYQRDAGTEVNSIDVDYILIAQDR